MAYSEGKVKAKEDPMLGNVVAEITVAIVGVEIAVAELR
jgi:hypothetical protein